MHILFVVHGMGVHGADWSDPVRTKLNEVASRYPPFEERTFDQQVRIVPINYDAEFATHLQQWSESADALEQSVDAHAINFPDVLGWLRGASKTEKNFFWSHLVDVLLYRFFPLVSTPVRVQVMKQIAQTITEAKKGGAVVNASVMSHSLGTSVAHDALARLGTTTFDGSEAFVVPNQRFSNIFMVANVGQVLETDQLLGASCVHPLSINPNSAYCTRYFNFRHTLDPFPAIRAFKPEGWGGDFRPTETLDHLRDFNVHGFEHYLDHPAVHIPIINALVGGVIDEDAEAEALEEYPRVPPDHPCLDKLAAAEERYRQLVGDIKNKAKATDLIIEGARFLAAAKEAKDACGQ